MTRRWFAKLPMLLVFPALAWLAAACAGQVPQAQKPPTLANSEPMPVASPASDEASTPAETLARADLAYESQLGASRGQFSVDRQVAVLKQEVLLYTQFLERAEGQPEFEPAVRKSRERIADAKATLIFLENHMAEGEPPLAPSE
jgi:hypothetical protein